MVNLKRGISLVILVFSLSFPRILWVRQGKKILGNFEVFLDTKPKNRGKEGQDLGVCNKKSPKIPEKVKKYPKLGSLGGFF